jgi:hypothetical protein
MARSQWIDLGGVAVLEAWDDAWWKRRRWRHGLRVEAAASEAALRLVMRGGIDWAEKRL